MSDDAIFHVELNAYAQSACSPDLGDPQTARLLVIGPEVLPLDSPTFPFCGAMRLSMRFKAELGADSIESTVVTVTSSDGRDPMAFHLRPDKEPFEAEPTPSIDPNDFDEDDFRDNYFNVDLFTFKDGLRAYLQPGQYVLYAVLGPYKSNAVTIHVPSSPSMESK